MVEDVWVHDTVGPEVAAFARDVVVGMRERLPTSVLHDRRLAHLTALRRRRQLPDAARFLVDNGLACAYNVLDPVVLFPDL